MLAGYSGRKLQRILGIRKWRLDDITAIKDKLVKSAESDKVVIEVLKRNLVQGYLVHAGQALAQSADTLHQAASRDAMVISGIATDKALALTAKAPTAAPQLHLHAHVAQTIAEIDARIRNITVESSEVEETEAEQKPAAKE